MALKHRSRLNTSVNNDLFSQFSQIQKETNFNRSLLIDIAIELLIEEYKTKKKIGLK